MTYDNYRGPDGHFPGNNGTHNHGADDDGTDNRLAHRVEPFPTAPTGRADTLISLRTTRCNPQVCVVSVGGELDLETSPRLADHLAAALAQTTRTLVIDLSEVEYVGSVGLATLIATHDRATERGAGVHIVGNRVVRRLLTVSGLLDHFDVSDCLNALLSTLRMDSAAPR